MYQSNKLYTRKKRTESNSTDELKPMANDDQEEFFDAATNGRLRTLKRLVAKGTIVMEEKNSDQRTALYLSCKFGHLDCVKYLVSVDADIYTRNPNECTTIYTAATEGHVHIIDYLDDLGVDVCDAALGDCSTLYRAAQMNRLAAVQRLHELGEDVNRVTDNGVSSVYCVCQKGYLGILKRLYELGADVNLNTTQDCSPVYCASFENNFEIVKYLHKCGGKLNVKYMNHTALTLAETKKFKPLVRWLQKNETLKEPIISRTRSIQPELYLRAFFERVLILPRQTANGWIYKSSTTNLNERFPAVEYESQDDIDIWIQKLEVWLMKLNKM